MARWLRNAGYAVFSVYEEARGMTDREIIQKAYAENWILITNDKGFGEKVYRERHPHRGLIFLRLEDEQALNKIEMIRQLLDHYQDRLAGQFVVVTPTQVRFGHAGF
ncbi:MAG: DUF5615 family PIN-like protein [Nitrospirales bacterium]|nr:DUF5615 family PIN-like protein [Nitrospira sp.]MDR4499994.1 DUF5615 family PIN-like protein [Nitrospirales bacterium]